MALPLVHRTVDVVAMWSEDHRTHAPMPFRPAPAEPLGCFGPLPPLPSQPPAAGIWRAPSPRPSEIAGDGLWVCVAPARGARRGTVILVPPWKIPRLAILAGYERLLRGTGLEVWTVAPPHHLARATPGLRSGEGFVTPDLPRLRATFEQLVLELRVLAALARARGGTAGLVGLSLGALAGALAATAPEALDFAALLAPPADLAAVFASTAIGRRYLALAARAGAPPPPPALLAPMLAPFRPETRRPTARRILVEIGRDDAIALPSAGIALARAWGVEPRLHPRGHLTLLFASRALRRELATFVRG